MRARDDNEFLERSSEYNLLKRHGYLVHAKGLENGKPQHRTREKNPVFWVTNKRQAQFEFCFFSNCSEFNHHLDKFAK